MDSSVAEIRKFCAFISKREKKRVFFSGDPESRKTLNVSKSLGK